MNHINIQEEIIKTVEQIVEKYLSKYSQKNTEIATVVIGISSDKYKVCINNIDYWIKDGVNIQPSIGDAVWVRTPNGSNNMNGAYICAKR